MVGKARRIRGSALAEEINVPGQSRIPVKDDGFASDNEVTNLESAKEPDELDDIRRKRGRAYDLRCHARTSGCGIG